MHADSRILPGVEPVMRPSVACMCHSEENKNMREPAGVRYMEPLSRKMISVADASRLQQGDMTEAWRVRFGRWMQKTATSSRRRAEGLSRVLMMSAHPILRRIWEPNTRVVDADRPGRALALGRESAIQTIDKQLEKGTPSQYTTM